MAIRAINVNAVERWNDDRLDDLHRKVDKLDGKVDQLISTKAMSWTQALTIASAVLLPMITLVGIVLTARG